MRVKLSLESIHSDLVRQVQEISGEDPLACYQCGKCAAGCPTAGFMDILPSEIIRLIQLGLVEEALHSQTIWLCAACQTCYARCPKGVDLPRLMEALRELAMQELGDQVSLPAMDARDLAEFPQQVFVAGLRKYTS